MADRTACEHAQAPSASAGRISRRSALGRAAALAAAATLPHTAQAEDELVAGFVYVGSRNDFGYNQTHAQAALKVAGLAGVRIVEQENVPESDAAASAMEAMIVQEGARLIFATSFGYYDPHVLKLAERYPQVQFQHCGGLWSAGDHPANVGTYFGRMHEAQYLAGIVAGSSASQIGFIASHRYPGVLRNLNAFAIGARSANPDAAVHAVFTGSWSDPVREAEAVNVLADRRVEAFGCSVDSARTVVQAANQRGLPACGYNLSFAGFGFPNYLTSAVVAWDTIVVPMVRRVQAGEGPGNSYVGGLQDGVVGLGPYGPAAEQPARQEAASAQAEFVAGQRWIWRGPLADNEGNQVLGSDERLEHGDLELRKMNWFVEGVRA